MVLAGHVAQSPSCSTAVPRGTQVLWVLWLQPEQWQGCVCAPGAPLQEAGMCWDVRLLAPHGNCSVSVIGSISSFVSPTNKVATSYMYKSFPGVLQLV